MVSIGTNIHRVPSYCKK